MTHRWKIALIACLLIGAIAPTYAWFAASGVDSLWTDQPVVINAREDGWQEMPIVEETGISIRARNDASNLYLLIRGANPNGRMILSGKFKQTITLWVYKPDHSVKDWGLSFDFSHAVPPELATLPNGGSAAPTLAAIGVNPILVTMHGTTISTGTYPSEIEMQTDLSTELGRQPIYEMRIPLSFIKDLHGREIFMFLESTPVSPELRLKLLNGGSSRPAHEEPKSSEGSDSSDGSDGAGGGEHGHHHHDASGESAGPTEIPNPLHIRLVIKLAKEPKH